MVESRTVAHLACKVEAPQDDLPLTPAPPMNLGTAPRHFSASLGFTLPASLANRWVPPIKAKVARD